jgi:hypothetical protein
MEKILLIVEKSKGEFFGRLQYDDNLIIDSGKTVDSLEKNFKSF